MTVQLNTKLITAAEVYHSISVVRHTKFLHSRQVRQNMIMVSSHCQHSANVLFYM